MCPFRNQTEVLKIRPRWFALLGVGLVCGCPVGPALPVFNGVTGDGKTTVVSWDHWGTLPDAGARVPCISADGRYVAFQMYNVDVVDEEIYVHDRQTGQTTLASVASDGTRANSGGEHPALSADGRYVAFTSFSTNLASGDNNGLDDVFVHDRQTGATERVSVSSSGGEGKKGGFNPAISADGRYVAFASDSDNLVPNDTNDETDIFVHDRQTGQTTRISVDSTGAQGDADGSYHSQRGACSISGDARFVVFVSDAPNLVAADTNGVFDVFVHELSTGRTTRVSADSNGVQASADCLLPAISADGRLVAFDSGAGNLSGDLAGAVSAAFVHDRDTDGNGVFDETCAGCRSTSRVDVNIEAAPGPTSITGIAISGNGRLVAFARFFGAPAPPPDSALSYDDSDVFIHDRQTGQTTRVSVDTPGVRVEEHWLPGWGPVTVDYANETRSPCLPHEGGVAAFVGDLRYSYSGTNEEVFVQLIEE